MGTVEISINEDGAVKVSQRYSLSALLRKLRSEGLERHRAVECSSCSETPSDGGPFLFVALILYSLVTYSSIAFIHSAAAHAKRLSVQLASYRRFPSERSILDFLINQMDLFGLKGIRLLGLLVQTNNQLMMLLNVSVSDVGGPLAALPARWL
ncbi:uncharacterized protein LOC139925110 isoform X2 [Centroberyx gerrardi]